MGGDISGVLLFGGLLYPIDDDLDDRVTYVWSHSERVTAIRTALDLATKQFAVL